MDASALELNVRRSLKKFFIDALGTTPVTFDTSLASPDIRGNTVSEWLNIDFGVMSREALSGYTFDVYCLTRQDPEGVNLARLGDTVFALLKDTEVTDGMKRIPLYDTAALPWSSIGAMVVQDIWDAQVFEIIEDETKVKVYTVRLRWGTKI